MVHKRFEVIEWATGCNDLLDRSRKKLFSASSDKMKQLVSRIPDAVLSNENTIVLVIAGQYSAGKSTIVSALTDREDIAIGAGITTEKVKDYDWNGVKIVDTPGVHTEIRPDHDEIAYRAISEADLLVFVLTNELFDSHLASHFRKLAVERDKAHEMMLVINKMRRCEMGNTQEAQSIIRKDLEKVLVPFSSEDLHASFIDAKSARESKSEIDDEVANTLWRKSGFEVFTQELNKFVREKGLPSRYTTALYSLEQVLQEALSSESTGDKDIDALEEIFLQRRRALLETQGNIPHSVDGEIHRTTAQIREEGRKIADMIHGSADQKKVDRELQAAQVRVQKHAEQLNESIQSIITNHMEKLDDRISAIANSELAKELFPRLVHRIEDANISPETMSKLKKASDITSKFGEFLIKHSFAPNAGTLGGLFKLNQYSGTSAHIAVKEIGHFFSKSFKPWEAVKWTRGIANAGRVLAVAGTVLTFILQIKEDANAAQLEKDLRESRIAVRSGFNDAANVIEMRFDKDTNAWIASTLTTEIEDVDKQLADLRNMQKSRSNLYRDLMVLLEETRTMIRNLHGTGIEEEQFDD